MIKQCPNCGENIIINAGGRKPFNIPFTKIYESLRAYGSVLLAAKNLGCSPAYIYKICGLNGCKPLDIIEGVPADHQVSMSH